MPYPDIIHHGAVDGVTGSCHQLLIDESAHVLIDCGLFQGAEQGKGGNAGSPRIDFDLTHVCALIATHVHVDHIGRIPWLLAAGFKGPIICSEPSAQLLPIVLEDALQFSAHMAPEMRHRILELIETRLVPLPYRRWHTLIDDETVSARVRLQRAGHILGSAFVEFDLRYTDGTHRRVVFSGDLGAPHAPILPPPQSPWRADTVVLESTYGDRKHEDRRSRRQRLQAVLEQALADEGTVLIPAFSIGRTQELLYELEEIIHRGHGRRAAPHLRWDDLPVVLDSPLATRFTDAYRGMSRYWNEEAHRRLRDGRRPLGFEQLLRVDTHDQHTQMVRHLADSRRPAVVIAGSGMCTGGRIIGYLKAMLGDPRHNVVFVGYQARGTPGKTIQQHGPRGGYVELDDERFDIRAQIHTLGGYSAHADADGLVRFVTRMRHWPQEVRLVHGDPGAKEALRQRLDTRYRESGQAGRVWIPEHVHEGGAAAHGEPVPAEP